MGIINRPVAFTGTNEERDANYLTHAFYWGDPNDCVRCAVCDCKTWHVAADYPCGAEVPRETVRVEPNRPTPRIRRAVDEAWGICE